MKTKSLNKKLVLNKKTVASLDKKEMSTAKGGLFTFGDIFCDYTGDRMCTEHVYCGNSFNCY